MTTVWARHALTSQGWQDDVAVTIDASGKIESVVAGQPASGYRVGILLPAPVNGHSHAFQRAMAGLTERRGPQTGDTFWTWRQLMYRFLDKLTPDHVETIATFVQMEMLEAGYATNVEFHYLHHQPDGTPYDTLAEMAQRIAAAAQQTGIGLTLLPVYYQYGGCDRRPLGAGQIRFGNDPDRYAQLLDACRALSGGMPADTACGIAPHSLRAVSPETLTDVLQLAGDNPIHMHIAEQTAEVDEVKTEWGKRPVEWLLDAHDVDNNWCLIHCTQMEPHETKALAQTAAVAGLCPITESSLGDGIFDGIRWMENNGRISIGSDSNVRISLSEELRTLEYSQRLRDHSRAAFATSEKSTGRRLFEAVCAGGAQAAARNTGTLAPGAWADLLALDDTAVDLHNRTGDTLLDSFIFAGGDRVVRDVWAAGRHVVHNGRHKAHETITRRYLDIMVELGDAL